MEERPAGQEPVRIFFRGACGRLACPDFFSPGRAARGPVQIFFRGWQPSWGFSYRESLIGPATPACGRPVWGLSGFFFRAPRKINPDRAESSQGQRPGWLSGFFFRGPAKFPDSLSGNLARENKIRSLRKKSGQAWIPGPVQPSFALFSL